MTGVVYKSDAISYSAIHSYEFISKLLGELGVAHEVRMFTTSADAGIVNNLFIVNNVQSLAHDDFFLSSDLIIAHFGIYNGIFDSLFLKSPRTKLIFYYHGVTPPDYFDQPMKGVLVGSFEQQSIALESDLVLTNTDTIAGTIRILTSDQVHVEPVGLPLKFKNSTNDSTPGQIAPDLRGLYVGRIVESKGVGVILDALEDLDSRVNMSFTFAYSPKHSSGELMTRLKELKNSLKKVKINFYENLSDENLEKLYKFSNLFIFPSIHEGFGLPVMEAFMNKCPVIVSRNGSLGEITEGYGLSINDINKKDLVSAVIKFALSRKKNEVLCDEGSIPLDKWNKAIQTITKKHSLDSFESRFNKAISKIVSEICSRPFSNADEILLTHRQSIFKNLIGFEISKILPSNVNNFYERSLFDSLSKQPKYDELAIKLAKIYRKVKIDKKISADLIDDLLIESAATLKKEQAREILEFARDGLVDEIKFIAIIRYAFTNGEIDEESEMFIHSESENRISKERYRTPLQRYVFTKIVN